MPSITHTGRRERTDELIDLDLDRMSVVDDDGPRCECDHGGGEKYVPCGAKARWRVTIECRCGGGHPRRVEVLCLQCFANRRNELGRESITVRDA